MQKKIFANWFFIHMNIQKQNLQSYFCLSFDLRWSEFSAMTEENTGCTCDCDSVSCKPLPQKAWLRSSEMLLIENYWLLEDYVGTIPHLEFVSLSILKRVIRCRLEHQDLPDPHDEHRFQDAKGEPYSLIPYSFSWFICVRWAVRDSLCMKEERELKK